MRRAPSGPTIRLTPLTHVHPSGRHPLVYFALSRALLSRIQFKATAHSPHGPMAASSSRHDERDAFLRPSAACRPRRRFGAQRATRRVTPSRRPARHDERHMPVLTPLGAGPPAPRHPSMPTATDGPRKDGGPSKAHRAQPTVATLLVQSEPTSAYSSHALSALKRNGPLQGHRRPRCTQDREPSTPRKR